VPGIVLSHVLMKTVGFARVGEPVTFLDDFYLALPADCTLAVYVDKRRVAIKRLGVRDAGAYHARFRLVFRRPGRHVVEALLVARSVSGGLQACAGVVDGRPLLRVYTSMPGAWIVVVWADGGQGVGYLTGPGAKTFRLTASQVRLLRLRRRVCLLSARTGALAACTTVTTCPGTKPLW